MTAPRVPETAGLEDGSRPRPHFRGSELMDCPRAPDALTVIAPCLNEAENIDVLVGRTLGAFDDGNIAGALVLVDDGSTDGTWSRIQSCTEREGRVRGCRHPHNMGMEAAWRTGLKAAQTPLVCLIDADLQNRPEDIVRLHAEYGRTHADLVQAVRHPARGVRRGYTFSRGLNFLLNLTFRMNMRDNKSGFILTRTGILEVLLSHRFQYRYFQCFLGASAKVQGYAVAEVDTVFDRRHGGASFLSRFPIGVCLRALWELLKFRLETAWHGARRTEPSGTSWSGPAVLADTTEGGR
ncbi:MAG: glycosyltransferase family 2 protein [Phycisphaerae bacterium]